MSIANTNFCVGEEFYLRLFFFIHTKIIINNILVSINFDFAFFILVLVIVILRAFDIFIGFLKTFIFN